MASAAAPWWWWRTGLQSARRRHAAECGAAGSRSHCRHVSRLVLLRQVAVEHPMHAELIGEHAEPRAPECVLQWLRNLASLTERREDPLFLGHVAAVDT